jgi:tRNA-specific 2-thiouridylase
VADKPDSQDICFVPNGDYAAVIEKLRPGAADPGEIVDMDGQRAGQHRGVIHYTIGQRRGLGIGGLADPLYVVKLDPDSAPRHRRPEGGAFDPDGPGARDQLAGRRPLDSRPEWHVAVKIRSTRPPRDACSARSPPPRRRSN